MKTAAELSAELQRIQRKHYADGDGGYAAVDELRAFWHGLAPEIRPSLKAVLVDQVSHRVPDTWSLAWEALVQEHAVDVAPAVLNALRSQQFDDEWRDDIVMGLLRLGYPEDVGYFTDYIRRRWMAANTLVLPLVAALARVSPRESLKLATEYVFEANRANLHFERSVASFVRHYLAVDERLLTDLVSNVKQNDASAAARLTDSLVEYLSKPWMLKELGSERIARIRSALQGAVGEIN